MSLLQSLKPFWPLLLTFILPRAITLLRTIRIAIRTRPQPTPLPRKAKRALNILFFSVVFFLAVSFKPTFAGLGFRLGSGTETGRRRVEDNVFVTTASRLSLSTDALFARLEMARKAKAGLEGLTELDEQLRGKLNSRVGRELYLRFGPETIVDCPFCEMGDRDGGWSYLLYHLPTNVLLWHLLHFGILGLVTSEAVSGFEVARWRNWCLLGAGVLVGVDVGVTVGWDGGRVDVNGPPPLGLYWVGRVVRPLILCLFDVVAAGVLWASVTGRLLVFSGGAVDGEMVRRRNDEMLGKSTLLLQTAQTKLRAANVARNAVVRDRVLRGVEDIYWREVSEVEARDGLGAGDGGVEGAWEDEDVQKAMAKAYGQGSIDVRSMRKEAEGFVRAVTGHMDRQQSGG